MSNEPEPSEIAPVPQPEGLTDADIRVAKTSVLISTAALLVAGNNPIHGRDLKRVVRVDCLGRVNAEIDRRLPGPGSQLGILGVQAPQQPQGDVDDELAMAAGVLEVAARAFAFFKDGDRDIGTVRAELRKTAVAYAKAEQRFGREVARMLHVQHSDPPAPALCGADDSIPFEHATLGQTCQNPRPCAKHNRS